MDLKSMTFVMACNNFFGRKPGQTLQEFNVELKALAGNDRTDMIQMFKTVGIDATKQGVGA
jgi:hypothetical protein